MRPVEKLSPGSTIFVEGNQETILQNYDPYGEAKAPLAANIGEYCSYCELRLQEPAAEHIEHIYPKSNPHYAYLETAWKNFLLSCSACNGAANKGTQVPPNGCHLPHVNNTFKSFVYRKGGVVIVNPNLSGPAQINATSLLNLVHLDKGPANSTPADKRWLKRSEVWDIAEDTLKDFNAHEVSEKAVINLARGYGHWSIWFTIFKGHDSIRKQLIESFAGTAANCFDPNNHYEPIDRNPGSIDPT